MEVDRSLIRRVLVQQMAEFSSWFGTQLIEQLRFDGSFVRQIRVTSAPSIILNMRIEIAGDQSNCDAGTIRLWLNVNDGSAIESCELFVKEDDVSIGNEIRSLGA
jgi:hypothetical protein